MKTWTVILLYPPELNAGDIETYTWSGKAVSPADALATARADAFFDNGISRNSDAPVFPQIAVIEGEPAIHTIKEAA